MPLVAGVHTATRSTTVEIRDAADGGLVRRSSAPHPVVSDPAGAPHPSTWWDGFLHCWHDLGEPAVAAISVAAQERDVVLLGSDGAVIGPVKHWTDADTAPDAGWLAGQLDGGAAAWAEAVGSVPRASSVVSKLSWLHRSESDVWAQITCVLLPHDWMTLQLSGRIVTDRGDASRTGYWSPHTDEYRWDVLAIVDSDRDWTSVVPTVLGPLDAAGEWSGVVVAAGTGDTMAIALGLALRPGDALALPEAPSAALLRSDHPIADPTGAVSCCADAAGEYLIVASAPHGAPDLEAVARSSDHGVAPLDITWSDIASSDLPAAVATGACVQATAVLEQSDPGVIAQRWGLGNRAADR